MTLISLVTQPAKVTSNRRSEWSIRPSLHFSKIGVQNEGWGANSWDLTEKKMRRSDTYCLNFSLIIFLSSSNSQECRGDYVGGGSGVYMSVCVEGVGRRRSWQLICNWGLVEYWCDRHRDMLRCAGTQNPFHLLTTYN